MTAVQSSGSGITFLLAVAFFFRQWEVPSGSENFVTSSGNALCILFPTKKIKPKRKQRQAAEDHSPSSEIPVEESILTPSNDPLPSAKDIIQLNELMIFCTNLQQQERSIKDIDQDAKIALVDEAQGRMHDANMFEVDDLEDSAAPTTATTADVDDELTLAKTLIAIKADKPKAIIDADRQLAEQIKAQEREQLSIEERSKLLAELIKSRRKYFAAKRAEEIRNKPPTKAQQKSLISKRARQELEQESAKKQKLAEQEQAKVADDDTAELEGKKRYFKIIRADRNSQNYLTFRIMFKNFNREDLEVLRSIVKERFKKIKLVDDIENLLFQTLKTMFEPYVEDIICKYQQGAVKVNNWKLFDSCGVYCVTTKTMVYYLLVEKMYPFTNNVLHQLWSDVRLQVDYESNLVLLMEYEEIFQVVNAAYVQLVLLVYKVTAVFNKVNAIKSRVTTAVTVSIVGWIKWLEEQDMRVNEIN
nr:hypothetical protein [Tanacetum cinerariifolium]